MKLVTIAAAALILTGCAGKDLIGGQVDELKALDAYHDAQRDYAKAEDAMIAASDSLAAATLNKAEAKQQVTYAKKALDEVLGKK